MKQIGFIGCGKMAGAIISAIKNDYKVTGSEINEDIAKSASQRLGIEVYRDNKKLAEECDVIFIATKGDDAAYASKLRTAFNDLGFKVETIYDYDAIAEKVNDLVTTN